MSTNNSPKQSVLEKLHKKSISAKDIANQFWCEKQVELNYLHGFKFTKDMNAGMAIHQQLQVEVYKALAVEPVTYPDKMYKTAYENILSINTLAEKKVAREIKIFGSLSGYNVVGQIDELRMDGNKVVVVENKTVGRSEMPNPEFTKPHVVQARLYRKMLQELRDQSYKYQNFDIYSKVSDMKLSDKFMEGLRSIGVKEELISAKTIYTRMFESMSRLPELSDSIIIHYVSRNTGSEVGDVTISYDAEALKKDIMYAMGYWRGEREAAPVLETEKWKCNMCRFFGKECTVWS